MQILYQHSYDTPLCSICQMAEHLLLAIMTVLGLGVLAPPGGWVVCSVLPLISPSLHCCSHPGHRILQYCCLQTFLTFKDPLIGVFWKYRFRDLCRFLFPKANLPQPRLGQAKTRTQSGLLRWWQALNCVSHHICSQGVHCQDTGGGNQRQVLNPSPQLGDTVILLFHLPCSSVQVLVYT